MRITQLRAENVKRLRAVDITPTGSTVEIRGNNAAGKSSVLDAIAYALGGTKLCAEQPIRTGQATAEAVVTLDNGLVVRRTWTRKGSYLSVTTADGQPVKSPQAVLDALTGKLTFDPLQFYTLKPADQAEQLLDVLGIRPQLQELEAREGAVYANRTEWNREVERLRGAIAQAGDFPPDLPDARIDFADAQAAVDMAVDMRAANNELRAEAARASAARERARDVMARARQAVQDLETKLMDARRQLQERTDEHVAAVKLENELQAQAQAAVDPDVAALRAQLGRCVEVNALIDRRDSAAKWKMELAEAERQAAAHTRALDSLKAKRADVLKSAAYPVPGLGYDGQGVTFGGVPLAQASAAERMAVSLAIAMRLNPDLRVLLVRDGSLLDEHMLAKLSAAVEADGYQMWIERVGTGGLTAGSIVIDDGTASTVTAAD